MSNLIKGTVFERLAQYKKCLASVSETLKEEMETWERKEYTAVRDGYVQEIASLEQYISETF